MVDTQEGYGSDPKIDLGERSHFAPEEIVELVNLFAADHPDLYEEWIASELQGSRLEHIGHKITDRIFSPVIARNPIDISQSMVALRGEVRGRAISRRRLALAAADRDGQHSSPKIDLRKRSSFTPEEAVGIVDRFASLHPDLYEEWLAAELRGTGIAHISKAIKDMVFSQVIYEDPGNVYSSMVDLRREAISRAKNLDGAIN